ncbi:MAG: hypothetical protein M5U09_08770 [Gammaproteobacteria bacterium]|nr:hypothetical protein [Gammaproteobacteria bacterium]
MLQGVDGDTIPGEAPRQPRDLTPGSEHHNCRDRLQSENGHENGTGIAGFGSHDDHCRAEHAGNQDRDVEPDEHPGRETPKVEGMPVLQVPEPAKGSAVHRQNLVQHHAEDGHRETLDCADPKTRRPEYHPVTPGRGADGQKGDQYAQSREPPGDGNHARQGLAVPGDDGQRRTEQHDPKTLAQSPGQLGVFVRGSKQRHVGGRYRSICSSRNSVTST